MTWTTRYTAAVSTLVAFGLLAGLTQAADAGDHSKELEILYKLTGRWKIEEQYPPMPPDLPNGGEGRGDVVLKKELEGMFVIGEYRSRCRDLNVDIKGHAVFTYDPERDLYRYWWFDNYGRAREASGTYNAADKALVFTHNAPGGDERHTFKFVDDDNVVYTWEQTLDGSKYDLSLTTNYIRKGSQRAGKDDDDGEDLEEPAQKPKPSRRPGVLR